MLSFKKKKTTLDEVLITRLNTSKLFIDTMLKSWIRIRLATEFFMKNVTSDFAAY